MPGAGNAETSAHAASDRPCVGPAYRGVRDPERVFRETLRYTLLSAAVLIVIVNVLFSEKFSAVQAVLNTSLLDWVGRLSYSIYVWHYAARSMLSVSSGEWWQNFVLWVTVTLLASAASYYLIEQPISEFRHRFGYRSPKHAATR